MVSNDELEDLLFASRTEGGTTRRQGSMLTKGLWALASVPIVAMVLLGLMALRVRIDQGSWPTHNNPDPKDLGVHNLITTLFIIGSFAVLLLLPIVALTAYFTGNRRFSVRPLVVGAVGVLALFLILRLDLWGIGNWIAD